MVNSAFAPRDFCEGHCRNRTLVKDQGMNPRHKKAPITFALLLVLAATHINFAIAKPEAVTEAPAPAPPPITAILTTRANRPITVNGAQVVSGATIVAGSIIETPDLVGGTINLGSLSNLEIAPNTKLTIDFDENGNMRVTLIRGCATARTKKNVIAQVDTSQGVAGKTVPQRQVLFCVSFPSCAKPT